MVFVGCKNTSEEVEPINGEASEEAYYLTGELMEQNDLSLLVDTEEAGLAWISFDGLPEVELVIGSKLTILHEGAIAESYPVQARGISIEKIEPADN